MSGMCLPPALPLIDWRTPEAPQALLNSLRHTGFAALTQHPLSQALIDTVCAEWLAFFLGPDKAAYTHDPKRQDGWFSPAVSETAKGHAHKDLKEFFHVYPWGRCPAAPQAATLRYRAQAVALAEQLLAWVEAGLPDEVRAGLAMPLSAMISHSEQTLLRVLHYPPLRGDEPAGALRAAAHEDINLLTLLPAAPVPGLQVLQRKPGLAGRWLEVPCEPGTLVVNTGDMLSLATGGWLPSTTHRVLNPSGPAGLVSRISLPLFLHPRPEVRLSAQHTQASYLLERLRELGLKP
jgi:isopenicillin N synthase-like dioxygenase